MSEILIEKLEQVLGEFRKLNADKLGAYGNSVTAMGEQLKEFNATLKQMKIPEEVRLRHEHVYEHKNINVWVKVMIVVCAVTIVSAISYCWYNNHTYQVNEENVKYNQEQRKIYEDSKANLDWLLKYERYMIDTGAPNRTLRYIEKNPLPK